MVRNSVFAALGFIGLLAAGTAGGSAPALAHGCGSWNNWCRPHCGPWNNWCRPHCGPWNGWCSYWRYPGISFNFGYRPHYWGGYGGGHYAYRNGGNWNGNGGGHYDRDDYDRDR